WAALWALAAQAHRARTGHAIGWANPLLYGLANSPQRTHVFHDVGTGDNGYYQAGPGWDAVTGWGSPNADALVQALASKRTPRHAIHLRWIAWRAADSRR